MDPPDQRGIWKRINRFWKKIIWFYFIISPCPDWKFSVNCDYLPRNGTVTFKQITQAVICGFNMSIDIGTILATFTVLITWNIITETFSIGTLDLCVGIDNIGGWDRHNCIENDISPTREDFSTGYCDNHQLSSRLFKQNVECTRKHKEDFLILMR